MTGKTTNQKQQSYIYEGLADTINPKHPLYQLSNKIPWDILENEFTKLYIQFGRPGKPIRLMTGLLMLKQMYNLSDEELIARWVENPYWQYFCGESQFQWVIPCDPSEMTYFRQRIGEQGGEKIFQVSALMHGRQALEPEVVVDTTVQEKNITFPTDTKLHIKIVKFCWRVAKKENIKLRQSYRDTIPKLLWTTRYIRTKSRQKEGKKAARRIKTLAGRLLRDLERKLSAEAKENYKETIRICHLILEQKKSDKNKIYSLHEPDVSCIAKGKEHKKYEFGSKAGILISKNSGVIVGAKSFTGNPYDGNTLETSIKQYYELFGKYPKAAIVDEGYRGNQYIFETEILRVHKQRKKGYSRWQWKQRFRRRAAVEATNSHLKYDYRLVRNYLKGIVGDSINLLLACAAYNFKKLMRKLCFLSNFLKAFFEHFFVNVLVLEYIK